MKIEIRFTLVDNENWLLANLYALTSINKKKTAFYILMLQAGTKSRPIAVSYSKNAQSKLSL